MMINRIKAPAVAVAAMVAVTGCDLLDVDNPNSLVEESVRRVEAASGLANGAQRLVNFALSDVWEGPAVTSDELFWIGSRDAWGQLDQGFISNPENEFTDAAFPNLGRAVWMTQNAVEILEGHVATNADETIQDDLELDLARALMFRGMILMVVAEQQDDMTFSWKMIDGPPVSTGDAALGDPEGSPIPLPSMLAVMDLAISSFTEARTEFVDQDEDELSRTALALRARAYQSRVIMQNRDTPGGALAFPSAAADAAAALADIGTEDWFFNLEFSSTSTDCDMCANVNDRKENQVDLSLVTLDSSDDVDGVALLDPVTGEADLAITRALNGWKGGSLTDSGNEFSDLTVVSARILRTIIAEHELATNGGGAGSAFETEIDALRDYDDMDPSHDFASGGAVTDVEILQHMRRVNTFLTGQRLQDMYRWGLAPGAASDPAARWLPASDAVLRAGSMLPITIIEVRANCHLNGQECAN